MVLSYKVKNPKYVWWYPIYIYIYDVNKSQIISIKYHKYVGWRFSGVHDFDN